MSRPTWPQLPLRARLFRVAHIAWGALNLAALAHVWLSALGARPRPAVLTASVGLLSVEGVALLIGRGNCPFGAFQRRLGDPVPMFELFLPPRAAKTAIPLLTGITIAGFVALVARFVVDLTRHRS